MSTVRNYNKKLLGGTGYDKSKPNYLFAPMDSANNRAISRKQLTRAFGNMYNNGLGSSPINSTNSVIGPFRRATSAGDTVSLDISTTNKKYGIEANHIGGNNMSRLQGLGDGITRNGKSSYAGNPKFVYDGSDYVRFKRLMAINKNFSDSSFGGANNSQTQHAINRVRR